MIRAFQFPLHRDPRCNEDAQTQEAEEGVSVPFTSGSSLQPQPLALSHVAGYVSVPFTSGSSLQRWGLEDTTYIITEFQFPLHRDPRCNYSGGH